MSPLLVSANSQFKNSSKEHSHRSRFKESAGEHPNIISCAVGAIAAVAESQLDGGFVGDFVVMLSKQ